MTGGAVGLLSCRAERVKTRAVETSLSLCLRQKTAAGLALGSLRTTDWGRWQSPGTRVRGRPHPVIAHALPPGRCHRMAHALGSVPPRHGCEAAVAIFRYAGSVETRGKIATTLTCLAMTEDEAASRHFCPSLRSREAAVAIFRDPGSEQAPRLWQSRQDPRKDTSQRDFSTPFSEPEDRHLPKAERSK
jgi:hypothetical protein